MKLNSILNVFCFQRNDSHFVWKKFNSGNVAIHLNTTTATLLDVKPTGNSFKAGFNPSLAFRTSVYSNNLWRVTFVSQTLVNSSEDLYEREYISLRFEEGIHKIIVDTNSSGNNWYVPQYTQGKHLILGAYGYPMHKNLSSTQVVFFRVNDSIVCCFKDATKETLNLDGKVYVFCLIHTIM